MLCDLLDSTVSPHTFVWTSPFSGKSYSHCSPFSLTAMVLSPQGQNLAVLGDTRTPQFQMIQGIKVDMSLKQFTKPRPWVIYDIST